MMAMMVMKTTSGRLKKYLASVHPETLPKLKLWIPRYPLFGAQSFSFGNIFGVSGWTLAKQES